MRNPSQLPHAHIDSYLDPARLDEFAAMLKTLLGDKVTSITIAHKEITLISPKANLLKVLRQLRDDKNCQFKLLVSICGVDTPEREEPRFDVVYHLLSLTQNMRVRVKVQVGEGESVPSAVPVFSAAGWYERETYDMYGILFEDHPDLRRLLTDYDFEGHPLRKDFPLNGHVEVYYDEKEKRVAYKPVDLPQEFRRFDQQSPWSEAITNSADRADEEKFDSGEFK